MSKIKIVILGIGIAIVLAFVIGFGVDTFYKSPEYEDYCDEVKRLQVVNTKEACEAKDGEWTEFEEVKAIPLRQNELICTKISEDKEEVNLNCRTREGFEGPTGSCDLFSKCNKEFQEAEKPYAKNSFIIIIVLGLIAVIVGSYLKLTSVSSGIMGGGVLVMIYAAMRFWRNLDEYLRFAVLVITLIILIWIGYKKFKK